MKSFRVRYKQDNLVIRTGGWGGVVITIIATGIWQCPKPEFLATCGPSKESEERLPLRWHAWLWVPARGERSPQAVLATGAPSTTRSGS
jgi:hypothetical protein